MWMGGGEQASSANKMGSDIRITVRAQNGPVDAPSDSLIFHFGT